MLGFLGDEYAIFEYIIYALCFVLGFVLFIFPTLGLKEEQKDNRKIIKRRKIAGVLWMIFSIYSFVVAVIYNNPM